MPELNEEQIERLRDEFRKAAEKIAPLAPMGEITGGSLEQQGQYRGQYRVTLAIQGAVANEAFNQAFGLDHASAEEITNLGREYGMLAIQGQDPKTNRTLEGKALAKSWHDQATELAKRMKERAEGRTGVRAPDGQ